MQGRSLSNCGLVVVNQFPILKIIEGLPSLSLTKKLDEVTPDSVITASSDRCLMPTRPLANLLKNLIVGDGSFRSFLEGVHSRRGTRKCSCYCVGANNEHSDATSVASTTGGIPQGPTINPVVRYDQKAQRSYADVVRDNRSTHSIELINKEY